jgi:hypothetical protein
LIEDDEAVTLAKVAVVTVVRDTEAIVAAALLPGAMIGLPVM